MPMNEKDYDDVDRISFRNVVFELPDDWSQERQISAYVQRYTNPGRLTEE